MKISLPPQMSTISRYATIVLPVIHGGLADVAAAPHPGAA